jgi:hypothetical protein
MVVRSGYWWEYGGDGGGGEYVGFYVISTKIDYILISCATSSGWRRRYSRTFSAPFQS